MWRWRGEGTGEGGGVGGRDVEHPELAAAAVAETTVAGGGGAVENLSPYNSKSSSSAVVWVDNCWRMAFPLVVMDWLIIVLMTVTSVLADAS